jgi:hypothetical protein
MWFRHEYQPLPRGDKDEDVNDSGRSDASVSYP